MLMKFKMMLVICGLFIGVVLLCDIKNLKGCAWKQS